MKIISKVIKHPMLRAFVVIAFCSGIFTMCSVSTAKLTDIAVCVPSGTNVCDGDHSTIPTDAPKILCSANLKNAPSDTKVTFTWKFNGEQIANADVNSGSGVVSSTLTPGGAIAPGNYSVTLKINADNSEPITKEFKVE